MTSSFYPRYLLRGRVFPPELRKKIDEIVQEALNFCTPGGEAREPSRDGKTPSELRTYEVPASVVKEEQEILVRYNADNWQELLERAANALNAVFSLFQHVDSETYLDGDSLNCIAEALMTQPIDMLHDLCSIVGYFTARGPEAKTA